MKTKTQSRKVGVAGGFINQMMGNNSTLPEVGKGATELMYSDRHAYEVTEVSEDQSRCVLQQYRPERIDKQGMSESQTYKFEKLHDHKMNVVWRSKKGGCWCVHSKEVRYIPKFIKEMESKSDKWSYSMMFEDIYGKEALDNLWKKDKHGDITNMNVVDGVTKEYDNRPISIIFGIKEEYYDFSF